MGRESDLVIARSIATRQSDCTLIRNDARKHTVIQTGAQRNRRISVAGGNDKTELISLGCARDDKTKLLDSDSEGEIDCFAALAMTVVEYIIFFRIDINNGSTLAET